MMAFEKETIFFRNTIQVIQQAINKLEDFKHTNLKLAMRLYCFEVGRLPISEDKLWDWYRKRIEGD